MSQTAMASPVLAEVQHAFPDCHPEMSDAMKKNLAWREGFKTNEWLISTDPELQKCLTYLAPRGVGKLLGPALFKSSAMIRIGRNAEGKLWMMFKPILSKAGAVEKVVREYSGARRSVEWMEDEEGQQVLIAVW